MSSNVVGNKDFSVTTNSQRSVFQITIANGSDSTQTYDLFKAGIVPSVNGTMTTGNGFSYEELVHYIVANPTLMYGMKIRSANNAQLDEPMQIIKKVMGDANLKDVFLLTRDDYQFVENQVTYDFVKNLDAPFVIDGAEILRINVLANTTVTMKFEYEQIRLKDLFFKGFYMMKYGEHEQLGLLTKQHDVRVV